MGIFKKSPKILYVYAKTALRMRDLDTLPSNKHKKALKMMKRAVNTRWLSLHVSVDGVYDQYVGLLKTLNLLAEKRIRSCYG